MDHYLCFQVVDKQTKSIGIFDTLDFQHTYFTQPTVTPEDKLIHTINFLTCTSNKAPELLIDSQLNAIKLM